MRRVTLEHFPENQRLSEYRHRRFNALEVDTEDNFPCVLDKVQNFEVVLDLKKKEGDED